LLPPRKRCNFLRVTSTEKIPLQSYISSTRTDAFAREKASYSRLYSNLIHFPISFNLWNACGERDLYKYTTVYWIRDKKMYAIQPTWFLKLHHRELITRDRLFVSVCTAWCINRVLCKLRTRTIECLDTGWIPFEDDKALLVYVSLFSRDESESARDSFRQSPIVLT